MLEQGVKHKSWNNLLWNAGLLGNKLLSWNSYDDLLASGYTGMVTMRYLTARSGGAGRYRYEVPLTAIKGTIQEWLTQGAIEKDIIYNESAPDHCLTIQGELSHGLSTEGAGYHLFYSTTPGKMREVLHRDGKVAEGLQARMILQHFMDPYSFDDLMTLVERFPDHIIEFSTYGKNLGCLPGRNTVIWEVRDY